MYYIPFFFRYWKGTVVDITKAVFDHKSGTFYYKLPWFIHSSGKHIFAAFASKLSVVRTGLYWLTVKGQVTGQARCKLIGEEEIKLSNTCNILYKKLCDKCARPRLEPLLILDCKENSISNNITFFFHY